jgi:ABC-type nickel/cobalt efflux system permease component RcnA
MINEYSILIATTASIALVHTISGPDHYLPFIVISKARNWNLKKTLLFTTLCGLGHVGSSVLLGFVGIAFGIAIGKLELLEEFRGSIISWLMATFGLLYFLWGIRHSFRNTHHSHSHFHLDIGIHEHIHNHHGEHTHVHASGKKKNITPWILFTIFIFGPCEPLIPIVMYPAAKGNYLQMFVLTIIFSAITIFTMLGLVSTTYYGLKLLPLKKLEIHYHALAGGTIFLCGMGMLFLGL